MATNGYTLRGETEFYRDLKALLAAFGRNRPDGIVSLHDVANSMGQMAKMWSSRPTLSLRRALVQAEIDGIVTPMFVLSQRGGKMKMFQVHLPEPRQLKLEEAESEFPF